MSIIGIERLIYGVESLEEAARFFNDFGLVQEADASAADRVTFRLPEGSRVILLPLGHPDLPKNSLIQGAGVQEVIWGVDSQAALDALVAGFSSEMEVVRGDDGVARFVAPFGIPMGLVPFGKRAIAAAPQAINSPGHIGRMNQNRRWRVRAAPKVIAHVVFAIPDYEAGYGFMIEKLGFRVTDKQCGFGIYLRADGTFNHHNFLLLNANAHLPDMDGTVKFHHANFGVDDIDEIMIGANHMSRKGWEASHFGLGRHRVDSALFYYLPCPAGGEAEYGTDSDCVDDSWVPREWLNPLFGYAHHVHNLPPFLQDEPSWDFRYLPDAVAGEVR